MAKRFKTLELVTGIEPLHDSKNHKIGDRDDHKRVIGESRLKIQVQELVYGPLGSACRALQPRENIEWTFGNPDTFFGIDQKEH